MGVVAGGSGPALTFSPGRLDPTSAAFDNSRKPLAGEFTFHGARLFVVANHFNSKGGDDPLFGLVERAAAGALALGELVALFWHCLAERPEELTREAFGDGVVAGGLAAATPVLKVLLAQILAGR